MSIRSVADRRAVLGGLAAALATPAVVRAQAWPSQVIRFVVPFTPGGSTDILARVIAQKLEPLLRQSIIIENRPGAGGATAASQVAKADPDGHTFMMGHIGTLAFNPSLYPNLPYDPQVDFRPVSLVATVPNILVVHPDVPARNFREFVTHVSASPGKLNFGSGGNGSAAHIAGAYMLNAAGLDAVHIPYRGTAPAVNDLVAGTIQFILTGGPAVLPLVAAGRLRALAVSSLGRAPFAPDLPTIAESGLSGFEAVQWYGLVAPAKTPDAIVTRLNGLISGLMDDPAIVKTLQNDGALALRKSPEEFGEHLKREIELWRGIIRNARISIG